MLQDQLGTNHFGTNAQHKRKSNTLTISSSQAKIDSTSNMKVFSSVVLLAITHVLQLTAAQNLRAVEPRRQQQLGGILDDILDLIGGGDGIELPDVCETIPEPCTCECDDVPNGVKMIYKRSLDPTDPNRIRCFPGCVSPFLQYLYDCITECN